MSELEIVSEGLQKIGSVMASLESGHALKFIKAIMDRRMDLKHGDVLYKTGQDYIVSRGGLEIYNILYRQDGEFEFNKIDPRDAILKSLLASVAPALTQSQINLITQNETVSKDLIIVSTTSIDVKQTFDKTYVILYNYKLHNMTNKKDNIYFILNDELECGSFTLDSTKEQNDVLLDIDHQIKLLEQENMPPLEECTSSSESEYEAQKYYYSDFNYWNRFNSVFDKYTQNFLDKYENETFRKLEQQIYEKYVQPEEEQEPEQEPEQEYKVFEIMHVDELRKMQLHNFGLIVHEKFQTAISTCAKDILIENIYPQHCIDWLKKECADKGYSFKQFPSSYYIEF